MINVQLLLLLFECSLAWSLRCTGVFQPTLIFKDSLSGDLYLISAGYSSLKGNNL